MLNLCLLILSSTVILTLCADVAVESKNDDQLIDKRKFYAWAGKRSSSDTIPDDDGIMEKRKFYAWAGKRASAEIDKRKFYAWAGKKRNAPIEDEEDANMPEKRKFYAWAGK